LTHTFTYIVRYDNWPLNEKHALTRREKKYNNRNNALCFLNSYFACSLSRVMCMFSKVHVLGVVVFFPKLNLFFLERKLSLNWEVPFSRSHPKPKSLPMALMEQVFPSKQASNRTSEPAECGGRARTESLRGRRALSPPAGVQFPSRPSSAARDSREAVTTYASKPCCSEPLRHGPARASRVVVDRWLPPPAEPPSLPAPYILKAMRIHQKEAKRFADRLVPASG